MAEQQPAPTKGPEAAHDLTGRMVGRFHIRARLGAGGMGEVYLAEDTVLKRRVAVKRMAPRLQADEQHRRRFLAEARRASALTSEHIAGIYDVLEEQGEIFLVMEYVEGVTLRRRLEESVSLTEFLEMAGQCAEALVAAHAKGIVHRDIKPENIILTPAGQVKILDFGVAKRLLGPEQNAATASFASADHKLSGTPGYMAPEILLEEEPDSRADIFSLGVVFYEALTGRHPFQATGFVAMADRVLHETPAPVTELNPRVPVELERIVAKMLAKDRTQRYATAADLLVDLRHVGPGPLPVILPRPHGKRMPALVWSAMVAVVLVGLALAFLLFRRPVERPVTPPGQQAIPEQKNLVVLPFQAIGGGVENQVYCDGLTETVTSKLARVHTLQVPPSQEVRARRLDSIARAREELGANLVLAASWQRSGNSVRINLNLIDARTSRQLRTDTITATLDDPFALQDHVVASAVRMLDVEVEAQEARNLTAHGTSDPVAYGHYLRGRGYLQDYRKPENLESAIAVFNRALEHDAHYALAYAGLGQAYRYKYWQSRDPKRVEQALAACQKAVALDAGLADGRTCLGMAYIETGKYEQATKELERAAKLDPASDDAHRNLASAYERLGRSAEAERTYRRAIELRPNYWAGYSWLGSFYYSRARYREAAQMFGQVVALAPDSFSGYNNLGATYVQEGNYEEAIRSLEHSLAIRPAPPAYTNLGNAYFYLRRFPEAARNYQEAIKLDDRNSKSFGNLGDAYYWTLGQRAQAAGAYRKAVSLDKKQLGVNSRDVAALGRLAKYHAMLQERKEAMAYLDRALALAPDDPEVWFKAALVHNEFGETDQALKWLEKSVAAGYSRNIVRDDPIFDNLHSDPRFQKLLGKAAGK